MSEQTSWEHLPDLASRAFGGTVMWASDELFAEKENLIDPAEPRFELGRFGAKGQIYDGWETRRRREPGDDQAVIRLGQAGILHGVVVDTAYFKGNYPPQVSVQGCGVEGYPSAEELVVTRWDTLVERAPLTGDATHRFDVESDRRYTHLRLIMHPDGGIARLRAHGRPIVDPRLSDPRSFDLAARCNGAEVVDCSDMFYSSPANMLAPGFAAHQAEGWETARRRDGGNDWVLVRLACTGTPRLVELDTSNLKGNAPGWAALSGCDTDPADPSAWRELLPRTRLQPDTAHRFRLPGRHEVNHLKLDIYPDGGLARLRLWGALSPDATGELLRRWFDALPRHQACQVLADVGVSGAEADRLVDARPMAELPAQLRHDIA